MNEILIDCFKKYLLIYINELPVPLHKRYEEDIEKVINESYKQGVWDIKMEQTKNAITAISQIIKQVS